MTDLSILHAHCSHFAHGRGLLTARLPVQKGMQDQAAPPVAQADGVARAPRKRLLHKQPDPLIEAPQAAEEPVALPIALPEEELEVRKALKALYFQLEQFRRKVSKGSSHGRESLACWTSRRSWDVSGRLWRTSCPS